MNRPGSSRRMRCSGCGKACLGEEFSPNQRFAAAPERLCINCESNRQETESEVQEYDYSNQQQFQQEDTPSQERTQQQDDGAVNLQHSPESDAQPQRHYAPQEGDTAESAPVPTIQDFLEIYEEIKAFLLNDARRKMQCDENRINYLSQMMDTTVLGGKYNRGMTVLEIGHQVAVDANVGPDEYGQIVHDAAVCGWVIEFLQAHFLVEDDIMDKSITRRGKPCWYRHPGVEEAWAINDGMILLGWCTVIVNHYFQGRAVRADVLDLLHEQDYRTLFGQFYDVTAMVDSTKIDPNKPHQTTNEYTEFTIEHYKRIVTYKTAYYTYYLPLAFGKAVCGRLVPKDLDVEEFSVIVGEYFQIQDDFLDCFGDPEQIKKIGTDIEDQKCSWLAVTFLSQANPAQKAKFKANYGQKDPKKVAVIKQMYREAQLIEQFEHYEAGTVEVVEEILGEMQAKCPSFAEATFGLWAKTYQRKH